MKKIADDLKIKYVMYSGMLLRLFYIIFSPVIQSRQYDLGTAAPDEGILTGHLGYIYYLFINKHFTDFDPREVYQFFHPPLHHIIEALWMNVISLFTDSQDIIVEWLQVPTFIYSCVILLAVYGLSKEMKLGTKASLIAMIVTCFHPTLIFMAGSLNNDGLSFMFQFLILYITVRWYYNKTNLNIVLLALSIGLGMLSKLSVGLLAVPVAFVFLCVFISDWKDNKTFPVRQLLQYILFGIICVPIGMAWAVRCLIRFNMPLNYVNHLPNDSWQYVGNYSMMERFFIPNPIGLLKNLSHGSIGYGENMWVQMFRTAALGECDLAEFPFICKILLMLMVLAAFVVALIGFVMLIKIMLLGKEATYPALKPVVRWFLLITYIISFASYVNFCVNYPHQCTMNFRYIVPTVLMPAIAIGLGYENSDSNKNAYKILINTSLIFYVIMSIITILVWSFIY